MKISHPAALAVFGWYLMAAPMNPLSTPCVPLSKWKILKSFDTAVSCERALGKLRQPSLQSFRNGHGAWDNCGAAYDQWKCIASDDPRLVAK